MTPAGERIGITARRLLPIATSQTLGLACGLAGVRLTTELVPPVLYGPFAVFVTFTPLGMWVVHAGLVKYVSRYWAEAAEHSAIKLAVARAFVRKLPWLAIVTACAALIAAPMPWGLGFVLLFATAAALSWSTLVQSALQATRQHWRDFTVSATGSVTRSFIPPLLFVAANSAALGLYGGFALHAVMMGVAATLAFGGISKSRSDGSTVSIPPVYEGPLFIGLALCGWAMAGLHRWLMTFCFGPAEGGYFALAANLAMLIPSVLGTMALQYFQPEFFATDTSLEGRRALARKVDRVALGHAAVSILALLLLRTAAPMLVGPLIRETYAPAVPMLLSAGAAMLALVTGWFYHSMLLAVRNEPACGRLDIANAIVIAASSVIAATVGEAWLLRWMLALPLVTWLFTRTVARRYLFHAGSTAAPAPVR